MNKKLSLTLTSNFINHYSLALSLELKKYFSDFHFVIKEKLPEDRLKMGFNNLEDNDFIVKEYEQQDYVQELIDNSDVVISDYTYNNYLKSRLKTNKITFVDSERLFKSDNLITTILRDVYYMYNYHAYNNARLLCISAYAAKDYNKLGLFKNRTYKWGYFPEPIKYKNVKELINNKKKNSIIWAGRLIKWKHPEYAVEIAKMLKHDGYSFIVNIIGNGDMEEELKAMINKYDLNDCVHMLGSMSPDKVRKHMEESEIYLFSSDRGEGWGVVLNEAMNSCCACVSSYETGSTPFLINDSNNGLIYKNNDIQEAYRCIKQLLDDNKYMNKIMNNAYKTIIDEYNPSVAAGRLYNLCEELNKGNNIDYLYKEGILSKAGSIE